MDRNSITGLVIITLILIGFWFVNKPDEQQIEAARQRQDSLRIVELKMEQEKLVKQLQAEAEKSTITLDVQSNDEEAINAQAQQQYGQISPFVEGEKSFTTLENEKIKMIFSNQGGKIYSVELKDYKTSGGDPLILFDGDKNKFGFNFTHNTRIFNTNQLYFNLKSQTDSSVVYELALPTGESLAFNYTLPKDEYMAKFIVNTHKKFA